MSKTYSSNRYKGKGKGKDSPSLWQIFFSDEKPSVMTSNGSRQSRHHTANRHARAYPVNTRMNPFELDEASISSNEDDDESEIANGHLMSGKDIVVVYDKKKKGNDVQQTLVDTPGADDEENALEEPSVRFTGARFLIRTDSDLELALPGTRSKQVENSCYYCCVCCPKWPIWRTYVLLGVGLFVFLGVWAGILYAILAGLGAI